MDRIASPKKSPPQLSPRPISLPNSPNNNNNSPPDICSDASHLVDNNLPDSPPRLQKEGCSKPPSEQSDKDAVPEDGLVSPTPSTCSKKSVSPGYFYEGLDVLARWSDGMVYLGTILKVEEETRRCFVVFEDSSEYWCLFKDLQRGRTCKRNSDIICEICEGGSSESPNEIVICEKCELGYHQLCHRPQIDSRVLLTPDEPWFCRQCVFANSAKIGGALKRGPGARVFQEIKKNLPYKRNELKWDKGHKTNAEKCYCYCGGPGDWYLKMLQCCRCKQWFHEACVQCLDVPMMYGDRFYIFVCSVCNDGPEYLKRLPIKWVDLAHLLIYNLTLLRSKKYYDFEMDIVPFLNDQWNNLKIAEFEGTTRLEKQEHLLTALNSTKMRFACGREFKQKKTLWGLRVRNPPVPPTIQLPAVGQITDEIMNDLKMKGRKVVTFVPVPSKSSTQGSSRNSDIHPTSTSFARGSRKKLDSHTLWQSSLQDNDRTWFSHLSPVQRSSQHDSRLWMPHPPGQSYTHLYSKDSHLPGTSFTQHSSVGIHSQSHPPSTSSIHPNSREYNFHPPSTSSMQPYSGEYNFKPPSTNFLQPYRGSHSQPHPQSTSLLHPSSKEFHSHPLEQRSTQHSSKECRFCPPSTSSTKFISKASKKVKKVSKKVTKVRKSKEVVKVKKPKEVTKSRKPFYFVGCTSPVPLINQKKKGRKRGRAETEQDLEKLDQQSRKKYKEATTTGVVAKPYSKHQFYKGYKGKASYDQLLNLSPVKKGQSVLDQIQPLESRFRCAGKGLCKHKLQEQLIDLAEEQKELRGEVVDDVSDGASCSQSLRSTDSTSQMSSSSEKNCSVCCTSLLCTEHSPNQKRLRRKKSRRKARRESESPVKSPTISPRKWPPMRTSLADRISTGKTRDRSPARSPVKSPMKSPSKYPSVSSSAPRSPMKSPQVSPPKKITGSPPPVGRCCVNGAVNSKSVSLNELRKSISSYFGAEGRLACGERYNVLGKRKSADGKVQYLIQWDGTTP